MTTVELVAGGIAGAMGILLTQPMDTIRIRLQDPKLSYGGIGGCAVDTVRAEGIRGLFKGVGSPMLTVGIMNALLFFTYEGTVNALAPGESAPSISTVMTAGAVSGAASAFVTAPTELVKCIAQINVHSKGTLREEWAIFRHMMREHGAFGAHGPLRGIGITVVRETPSFALYFGSYETLSRRLDPKREGIASASLIAGGCAGTLAWACIYPIDVVKTRWTTAPVGKYRSIAHCLRSSLAAEGPRFVLRGCARARTRASLHERAPARLRASLRLRGARASAGSLPRCSARGRRTRSSFSRTRASSRPSREAPDLSSLDMPGTPRFDHSYGCVVLRAGNWGF